MHVSPQLYVVFSDALIYLLRFPSLRPSAFDTMCLSHNVCADLYFVGIHSTPLFSCGGVFYCATKPMLYVKHVDFHNLSGQHHISLIFLTLISPPTCIGRQTFLPPISITILARALDRRFCCCYLDYKYIS